jgi:molecular chaperone GrpE (heat shock protein)
MEESKFIYNREDKSIDLCSDELINKIANCSITEEYLKQYAEKFQILQKRTKEEFEKRKQADFNKTLETHLDISYFIYDE